jgi:NADH dehydrogenase
VLFGAEDILINNIAWLLRHVPVFLIPGSGEYRLQPVSVEDAAALAVEVAGRSTNLVMDAVGPEVFTFEELVRLIRKAVGSRTLLLHAPVPVTLLAARVMGAIQGDVVLTRDEAAGLMANLLVSAALPTCPTALSDWVALHANVLGTRYASELARHYGR